jgi:hypothetical protein
VFVRWLALSSTNHHPQFADAKERRSRLPSTTSPALLVLNHTKSFGRVCSLELEASSAARQRAPARRRLDVGCWSLEFS